jgi:osmotically inducible protein OsmC
MKERRAHARWNGELETGKGIIELSSINFKTDYNFQSRFEEGSSTNPEELISAAITACFSMALSKIISEEGYDPEEIATTAGTTLIKEGDGFKISKIELRTRVTSPSASEELIKKMAETAKDNCPVSKALAGVDIQLTSVELG